MHLLKTLSLIWTFYRNFLVASLLVTATCGHLFWKWGFSVFAGIFWLKIATLVLIYHYVNGNKKKEYYYYLNLGVSKVLLWTSTLLFDFALFIFLIIQLYKFK
jgi:hypothetical protein